VLLFDVLHMIPRDDQDRLLARIAAALEPGGTILIREADAAGGWRFLAVRFGNRVKALVTGNWRQRFAFRAHEEWAAALRGLGLDVTAQSAGEGTPFANSLVAGRRPGGSALRERAEAHDGVDGAAARVVLAAKPEAADRG
jgi:hypothetical protein